MARKDSEKDAERPHYYSQFWLDVAAGRRIIGAPKTNEEGDLEESDAPILSRPVRHTSASDGYHETIAHPDVEPDFENDDDVYAEPELEITEPILEEDEEEMGELDVPPIVIEEEEIPDVDFTPVDTEEEEVEEKEDDFFDEEEEDEEEDDLGWGGARGRKKPKPGRQAKLPPKPPVKKPTKRRGF